MTTNIPLGYMVGESERSSIAARSVDSDPAGAHEERMRNWITQLPRDAEPVSHTAKPRLDIKSRTQGIALSSTSILRGPPACFRSKRNQWVPVSQYGLRNNLLFSVGFLEMANACDFPANIWNQIPVPLFAAVLMGIGGSIALLLMFCAVKDLRLSYRNIQLLRQERRRLQSQLRQSTIENGSHGFRKSIQACLAVNTREFGFELIDRFVMDIIMGIGCLLVGLGTLLAIGGNNPRVFQASNLLSGYIGNTPAAIYGIVNAAWSLYVWLKADTHSRLSSNDIAVELIWPQLAKRHDTIKLHAIVYGFTSLVAGAGSLMTATLWYGYVMLVPCVCASAWCNWLWRYKCGYSRPMFEEVPLLDREQLITEIQSIALLKRTLKHRSTEMTVESGNLGSLLDVIQRYDLMTEFCLELYKEAELKDALFGMVEPGKKTIHIDDIVRLNNDNLQRVVKVLESFMFPTKGKKLLVEALVDRERCLLELLGSWYFYLGRDTD